MPERPSDREAQEPPNATQINSRLCGPSHRTAAPHPPVASILAVRGRPARSPAVPPVLGVRRRRAGHGRPRRRKSRRARRVPAQARRHHHREAATGRRQRQAGQRRRHTDRTLAHRRERQARHAELGLLARPARPRARGFRQPGQRGPRRRRRLVREHDCTGGAGSGLSDGLLPGPGWPADLAERHGQGRSAAAPRRFGGDRHRDVPVVTHA